MLNLTLNDITNNEVIEDCIRDRKEDLGKPDKFGLRTTSQAAAFSIEYMEKNFAGIKDSKILKSECGGKIGNKFLQEYYKCKKGNKEEKTYKIFDNVCETGLIPCLFNSFNKTMKTTGNLIPNMMNAGEIEDCDSDKFKQYGPGTENEDELFHVKKDNTMITGKLGDKKVYVVEDFGNLYNNVIQHLEENKNLNDLTEVDQKILISNDVISETYYVLLMIFLLFLIYKINNKK